MNYNKLMTETGRKLTIIYKKGHQNNDDDGSEENRLDLGLTSLCPRA